MEAADGYLGFPGVTTPAGTYVPEKGVKSFLDHLRTLFTTVMATTILKMRPPSVCETDALPLSVLPFETLTVPIFPTDGSRSIGKWYQSQLDYIQDSWMDYMQIQKPIPKALDHKHLLTVRNGGGRGILSVDYCFTVDEKYLREQCIVLENLTGRKIMAIIRHYSQNRGMHVDFFFNDPCRLSADEEAMLEMAVGGSQNHAIRRALLGRYINSERFERYAKASNGNIPPPMYVDDNPFFECPYSEEWRFWLIDSTDAWHPWEGDSKSLFRRWVSSELNWGHVYDIFSEKLVASLEYQSRVATTATKGATVERSIEPKLERLSVYVVECQVCGAKYIRDLVEGLPASERVQCQLCDAATMCCRRPPTPEENAKQVQLLEFVKDSGYLYIPDLRVLPENTGIVFDPISGMLKIEGSASQELYRKQPSVLMPIVLDYIHATCKRLIIKPCQFWTDVRLARTAKRLKPVYEDWTVPAAKEKMWDMTKDEEWKPDPEEWHAFIAKHEPLPAGYKWSDQCCGVISRVLETAHKTSDGSYAYMRDYILNRTHEQILADGSAAAAALVWECEELEKMALK